MREIRWPIWVGASLAVAAMAACSADAGRLTLDGTTSSGGSSPSEGGGTASDGGGGTLGFDGTGGGGGTDCTDGGPGCECEELSFNINTAQSCSLDILPGFDMDGEGFITLEGEEHRVFALDRFGEGHIVAWCDASTAAQLANAFNLLGYLGQSDDPKVASFGDTFLCEDGNINDFPGNVEWFGQDMPSKYKGDAAALAADYDVIILCGFRMPWTTDWSAELTQFVSLYGKGLWAIGEYEGVATSTDFENLTAISQAPGILFNPLNLDAAPADTTVALDCIPDLPPPD